MNRTVMEKEIAKLYAADQAERTVGWDNIDFLTMRKNDSARLQRARDLYSVLQQEGPAISGEILYQLGLLFQHSPQVDDLLIAQQLGEWSGDAGYADGNWLSVAAEDRYLLSTTGEQVWGTQFQKATSGEWERAPMAEDVDSGVTDQMRIKKGIPPREQQLATFLTRSDI